MFVQTRDIARLYYRNLKCDFDSAQSPNTRHKTQDTKL